MEKFKIPISKPKLTENDFLEIKRCFDSSWISSKSPWVEKFEKLFAKKISKTKYAIAVNSGTSALFLSLKALNIGVGDEVIIPSLTMIATINAVTWTGAKPVLIDSTSLNNWNINPEKIEERINKRTKAIIPVHLYGYPCDMEKIMTIAHKHKLFVIGDAAEAMGSTYKGKTTGNFSDIACFSLYTNKIITTGNGGMVCTRFNALYNLIKKIEFFDFNKKTHFKHNKVGYNLVLSGLQAALGYSQTKRFSDLVRKRKQNFAWYKDKISNRNFRFLLSLQGSKSNYWFPAIIARDSIIRNRTVKKLTAKGVETRDFFMPIHRQPVYRRLFEGRSYPVSEYFHKRGLLLPSYHDLSENQIEFISQIINRVN